MNISCMTIDNVCAYACAPHKVPIKMKDIVKLWSWEFTWDEWLSQMHVLLLRGFPTLILEEVYKLSTKTLNEFKQTRGYPN